MREPCCYEGATIPILQNYFRELSSKATFSDSVSRVLQMQALSFRRRNPVTTGKLTQNTGRVNRASLRNDTRFIPRRAPAEPIWMRRSSRTRDG